MREKNVKEIVRYYYEIPEMVRLLKPEQREQERYTKHQKQIRHAGDLLLRFLAWYHSRTAFATVCLAKAKIER